MKPALRSLTKSPGFTFIAILTLALGIGATTAMFSIVNRIVLSPLPYPEADRLVHLWEDFQGNGTGQNAVSGGVARSWQEQSTLFEGIAVVGFTSANLTGQANPRRLNGLQVSPNYLRLLRVAPTHGRDFHLEEGPVGRNDLVILTHAAWQAYFGGETQIVGQTIQLGNAARTVIGILSPDTRLNQEVDFIEPFDYGTPGWDRAFSGHILTVVGRMKPSVTLDQVRQEMAAITARIRDNFPDFKRKWGVTVVPMHEQVTGELRPQLLLLLGATACVLLIACANVAGLLLARAVNREKEMALRLALGATRWSITRQVLAENLLLSLIGGGAGVLLALWSVDAFQQWRPAELAPGIAVYLDARALGFAVAVSVLTGLIAGFVPAWRLARAHFDQLKSGDRSSAAGAHTGVRGALIVAQIALSLILLVGAGLLMRSLLRVQAVPLGFEPSGMLAADLTLESDSFRDPAKRVLYLDEIVRRAQSVPGVESAALSTYLPMQSGETQRVSADGSTTPPVIASLNFVSKDYLSTMRIPLLKGRSLDERDNQPQAVRTVLINTNLAAKIFPNADPIGQGVSLFGQSWEIVGLTGDVRVRGAESEAMPQVYLPEARASSFNRSLVVRTNLPPLSLARSVQAAILAAAPDQPVSNVRTYEAVIAQQAFARRLMLGLVALFAAIALTLAAVGLYGIIAFSVNSRTRELGIRSALGASRKHIALLVFSGGFKLTLAGIMLGLIGGYFLTRFISSFLFGVTATDPLTLACVSLLLLIIAPLACLMPAHRAMRIDPNIALRAE